MFDKIIDTIKTKFNNLVLFIKKYSKLISKHNVAMRSAAMTYYLLIAFVPLTILILELDYIFGLNIFNTISGDSGITYNSELRLKLNLFTIVFMFIAIHHFSKYIRTLSDFVNNIFNIKKEYKFNEKIRMMFIGLILVGVMILIASLLFIVHFVVYRITNFIGIEILVLSYLFSIIEVVVVSIIPVFIIALLYKRLFKDKVKIKNKHIIIGSIVTNIFWNIATSIFVLYLKNYSNYGLYYGSFSLIIIVLYFAYIYALGNLIGLLSIYYAHDKNKTK